MPQVYAIAVLVVTLFTCTVPGVTAWPKPPAPCPPPQSACTPISTVPFTITEPGVYCLTQSQTLTTATPVAILIQADNVVLDLQGHTVDGGNVTNRGISVLDRQNVTIRNGTIRLITYWGIDVVGGHGHLVEGLRLEFMPYTGILVAAASTIVRHNHIIEAGAYAIQVTGNPGIQVLENTIHDAGVGVYLTSVDQALVIGNRLSYGRYGVWFVGSGSAGKYRDNLTVGIQTPYTGGTDAGNNH